MTGVSLGLRSGRYGSLQQQQLQNGASLPTVSPPLSLRKPGKMSFLGSREKERILPRIFKLVGRRKFGMLLVLVASVAVLSFIYVVSKDEDASTTPYSSLGFTYHVRNFVNPGRPLSRDMIPQPVPANKTRVDITSDSIHESTITYNAPDLSIPIFPPTPDPCESFSIPPPPPADRKRTGPRPCPVCYVPLEHALVLMPLSPSASPILKNLSYVLEDNLIANESNGGSIFGGHPSLLERNESFNIRESMTVHCGFAKGKKPGHGTGFDISDADLLEMEECNNIVVASAIFGNYDIIQQPKNISEYAKKNVCFYMFIDEETETYIKNTGLFDTKRVGLWRVVVVHNLPYLDARRNGKVPKLLLHRLFPNARFSLWIDGKLKLVVDPYQVLERFLWRKKYNFAISRHYRRFDVFEEAEANKAAGKYDNGSTDYQIEFYKKEGLTPYSLSKLPITSDVPEGCVIVKEHIPITNLFTCLWFNEVDRFTSRDQISFSTVRDRIMSQVNWTINMFMDCERRNFVVQAYHRDLLEQRKTLAAPASPPPIAVTRESSGKIIPVTPRDRFARIPPPKKLAGKIPARRGRDKRSGSRRHHSRSANGRDSNSL